MRKRRNECTDSSDKAEVEEGANPVSGGEDGDWVLRELEDLSSELCSLVPDVLGGHDGEEWETGWMGVGERM